MLIYDLAKANTEELQTPELKLRANNIRCRFKFSCLSFNGYSLNYFLVRRKIHCQGLCHGIATAFRPWIINFQLALAKPSILLKTCIASQFPISVNWQHIRHIICQTVFNIFYQSKSFYQPMIMGEIGGIANQVIFIFCIHRFSH